MSCAARTDRAFRSEDRPLNTIFPASAYWVMKENPEATVKLVQDILS